MKSKLEEFTKGDKKAFDWVYSTYSSSMFGICMRYANCRDDAQEILQESFIKIYENSNKFDTSKEILPWLKTIVINTAINFLKVQKRMKLQENEAHFDQIVEQKEYETKQVDLKDQLLNTLSKMPDGYRTIFNLAVIDNLTHKEIANYLNISEGTSKSQLAKAKTWIRKQLENSQAYERRG